MKRTNEFKRFYKKRTIEEKNQNQSFTYFLENENSLYLIYKYLGKSKTYIYIYISYVCYSYFCWYFLRILFVGTFFAFYILYCLNMNADSPYSWIKYLLGEYFFNLFFIKPNVELYVPHDTPTNAFASTTLLVLNEYMLYIKHHS